MATITDLPALIDGLPPEVKAICERILRVSGARGRLDPPATMRPWIARHFGDEEAASEQLVIKVANKLTLEATLFNPLRAKRPHDGRADDDLDEAIAASLSAGDIFSDPLRDTPADAFGRVRGEHCVTASNIAKYDGWHGVVIFDEPHPLRFGRGQVADYLQTALRWLRRAHEADPAARFPIVTWNCLPKSGASIVHGHMQMSLATDGPYAAVERWARAAAEYRARYGGGYFDALQTLSSALGLTFVEGEGVAGYASLTPFKNRELLLTAPVTGDELPQALAGAIYRALLGLIDREGVRSFNMALYPPPFDAADDKWRELPWCARIVDRGDPSSRSSDVGAMELFGTPVVSADPFAVAAALRGIILDA